MFLFKKPIPEIKLEKTDSLLMVKCFVKGIYKARMQCVIENGNTILIGDIIHTSNRNYNKGYASLMMEKLLQYAEDNYCTYIYGNLSNVDYGHKDRLHHFYSKFGFTVIEFQEKDNIFYGKIEMFLKEA